MHLAAIHSRTHHDAHHADARVIHQALKRAPRQRVSCPFLKDARPSQTCARNLVERPRSRLEGAPGDASVPPPSDWASTPAGTELAGAVASAKCAPGAAVNAGQARASSKECAYEWLHDAFGRRRIDAEDTCDIIPESSSIFASTLIRETVSNLRSSVTAHVYWTVLDDSRTEAAERDESVRDHRAALVAAGVLDTRRGVRRRESGVCGSESGRENGRLAAATVPYSGRRRDLHGPGPRHGRAGRTGNPRQETHLPGRARHGRRRSRTLARRPRDAALRAVEALSRDERHALELRRPQRESRGAAPRFIMARRLHIFGYGPPEASQCNIPQDRRRRVLRGRAAVLLLMDLRPGPTCAARFGIDPRPEHQRFVRAARIGGAPTAAVLAFRRDATAARAARVFLHASNALLEAVDAAVNEAAVHAAAHGDVLVGCAVAASTGNDWEAWGCSGDIGEEAKQALRRANLDGEGPLQIQLWDAEQVVSHEHPSILSGATVAIHVRAGDDDLTAANDIRAGSRGGGLATTPYASVLRVAKELGVYPGAIDEFGNRDYFRVDATQHRKYVAVEDTLIATMPPNFHNGERLGTACLSLLAIAYFTGRVAVLPAALHFEKYYYLWEFIDVERSPLKVHFRESHFLSKARSHARRGVNAARVQVREDGTVSVSRVLDDDADDANARVYSRPEQLDPMALAVAAATREDVAVDADVLYLNVDEIPTHNALARRTARYVPAALKANGKGASSGKGARWLGFTTTRPLHLRSARVAGLGSGHGVGRLPREALGGRAAHATLRHRPGQPVPRR